MDQVGSTSLHYEIYTNDIQLLDYSSEAFHKSLRELPLSILVLNKSTTLFFCLREHKYLVANDYDNSWKEATDLRGS